MFNYPEIGDEDVHNASHHRDEVKRVPRVPEVILQRGRSEFQHNCNRIRRHHSNSFYRLSIAGLEYKQIHSSLMCNNRVAVNVNKYIISFNNRVAVNVNKYIISFNNGSQ